MAGWARRLVSAEIAQKGLCQLPLSRVSAPRFCDALSSLWWEIVSVFPSACFRLIPGSSTFGLKRPFFFLLLPFAQ